MPTYVFYDESENEEIEITMKISELDQFKEDNPQMSQRHKASASLISGVSLDSGKLPEGWKDKLRLIKEKHPRGGGVDHLL